MRIAKLYGNEKKIDLGRIVLLSDSEALLGFLQQMVRMNGPITTHHFR